MLQLMAFKELGIKVEDVMTYANSQVCPQLAL